MGGLQTSLGSTQFVIRSGKSVSGRLKQCILYDTSWLPWPCSLALLLNPQKAQTQGSTIKLHSKWATGKALRDAIDKEPKPVNVPGLEDSV